jgi:hypothetical protein
MENKIAMVNKELHDRLFEDQDGSEHEEEPSKIHRKHQLPPQLMLKNMIKKGLTNPPDFHSRPKTALNNFRKATEERQTLSRLRSVPPLHQNKPPSQRKYELPSEGNVEFDFITSHPKEFDEFDHILDRMKW